MDLGTIDFEWLADLHKSQCFTTCEVSNPAKSSDFGARGHTASLTDWHELLQLTAPDETCGIVFVRGQFPNTPGAILARAQRRDDSGTKGTFGTRLQRAENDADLELGERLAQGWVNLRWPYTRYELKRRDGEWDGLSGSYEEISFVRDETFVQVIRLKWGNESSLSDSDSVDGLERMTARLKVGGVIQFGCPCSNGGPPDIDTFQLSSSDNSHSRLDCVSERYQKKLEMHLFVDGIQQDITTPLHGLDRDEVTGTEVDTSSMHEIELTVGEPIIIVSTYALRSAGNQTTVFDIATFTDLEDHLGTCNTSVNMTDRLWTALCSTNYEASEAIDTCVVGRCVEQILGVSSVPFPPSAKGLPISAGPQSGNSTLDGELSYESSPHDKDEEIALICNIITPQYVDVQSAFFQIRLLVKVYNFINTRHLEQDLLERFEPLNDIRAAYLTKLRRFLRSSLTWLVNADLRPRRLLFALRSDEIPVDVESRPSERLKRCEQNRVRMNIDQSYNQACYATLAVWYVMKHCPQAMSDDYRSTTLLPKLRRAYDSVQKRASRDKEPTPKNDVLQWLHLSCLFLICNERFGTNENGEVVDGFTPSGLDRQEVIRTQQKFEKYVSRLKTSQMETYSVEHEELDRVLLLGEELGLDAVPTPFTFSLASSRANHTRKRIAERKRTTRFNPGPKVWKSSRIMSNSPWELLCTNHQGFLRITDDSNVKAARDRLFEFIMADYSFMASWDRADSNMIGKWWDLEPVSVICATILDLKIEGKLKSAMSEAAADELSHSINDIQESPVVQRRNSDNVPELSQEDSIRDILLQMKKLQEDSSRDHLTQMRQLLVQDEIGANLSVKAFDWVACKPARLFHPNWWVQSLQDTPEVYQAKQTKDVPLRKDVRRYLANRERLDIIADPVYTLENINSKVSAVDLQFLSVFDLHLTNSFTFKLKELTLESATAKILLPISENGAHSAMDEQRSPRIIAVKQASDSYNPNQLELYRKALFAMLNDSLVDVGAKHRILFAEKCSPSLVGSFIYMWHPDALDAIDSYFGPSSRFAENLEATMWTTAITISHWSIRPVSLSKAHLEMFKEHRNNGDFPPLSIARLDFGKKPRKIIGSLEPTDIVEERSSSLVITGDPSGYLWICSIWSSLTDADSITPPIHSLPNVLQRFIHQQACGRCLVFLILLGHLCEKLAGEYEMILSRLDIIVGLGEKVLLEGLEWGTSESVNKLKKMLWGLEALRVFDDRLSASLSQIQKAQEAMERTVKQEAGQQHLDLLQEYNNVIEEFEKRYGMLSDVQIRTQLKIRQVTGLRDGISTVTNVEDSQTALRDSKTTIKQGNNIRMLTYITIAYLPLGFITGLFSINHATFMDHVGNGGFAILVVIFILGTYALALSLEGIIDQWARLKKEIWGPPKGNMRKIKKEEEQDMEPKLSFSALRSCFGFRRRRGSGGGSVGSEEKISKVA